MEINYSLMLPRDALTVPIVRRLVCNAMEELGVHDDDIQDVGLAVTEACANVVEHSSASEDEYRIHISVNDERCDIRIVDTGRGFDGEALDSRPLDHKLEAERGRGILMMRALADTAVFTSEPEKGTIVHLGKTLRLREDSLLLRLAERLASGAGDGSDR